MKIKYPLPLKNITIRLIRRQGGLSPCYYELIIHGNGEGIYKGGGGIEGIVVRKGKISKSKIFTLFKYAREIGFFEMKSICRFCGYTLDKKGMIQCHECYIYDYQPCEIEIKIGNKKKNVIDWGWAPKRFKKFAKMIYRVYKPEKWISPKDPIHFKL